MTSRVVRVLTDQPAVTKTFDYLLPEHLGTDLPVGSRVRVPLGGRRVGAWIVALDVEPPPGVKLRPIAKLSGIGPPAELIDLAHWAAWRWAGRPATFLRTASPERMVDRLPPPPRSGTCQDGAPGIAGELAETALARGGAVLRIPPAADLTPVALVAARSAPALVLCPTQPMADRLARSLRRQGLPVARHPGDWAAGAAGATVVGTRAAAWAPVGRLGAVVVMDEHDEAHVQEQAPTWNAREVVIERARRAGVPCVLTSPCPSLEAQDWGPVLAPSKGDERAGWPVVDVIDRRDDDPRTGLFSHRLVEQIRARLGRVVCVLNRTGRARLLACSACGEIASCESCAAAVLQPDGATLACPRCGATRPVLCTACGATRLKVLRQGVSRVREELQALLGEPVEELTAGSGDGTGTAGPARVVVGTEAALHQIDRASLVAFLDIDQELLAPRYRAVEQAMGLLVRAARLLGGKADGGRLVLQTRQPRHEAVVAALHADPTRMSTAEAARRELLGFPPYAAIAEVSGPVADAFIDALGEPLGVEVMGPADGRWLLRAPDHRILCDALAATPRPGGRLRVSVDPLRI